MTEDNLGQIIMNRQKNASSLQIILRQLMIFRTRLKIYFTWNNSFLCDSLETLPYGHSLPWNGFPNNRTLE